MNESINNYFLWWNTLMNDNPLWVLLIHYIIGFILSYIILKIRDSYTFIYHTNSWSDVNERLGISFWSWCYILVFIIMMTYKLFHFILNKPVKAIIYYSKKIKETKNPPSWL